jgi:hypothetical protein
LLQLRFWACTPQELRAIRESNSKPEACISAVLSASCIRTTDSIWSGLGFKRDFGTQNWRQEFGSICVRSSSDFKLGRAIMDNLLLSIPTRALVNFGVGLKPALVPVRLRQRRQSSQAAFGFPVSRSVVTQAPPDCRVGHVRSSWCNLAGQA